MAQPRRNHITKNHDENTPNAEGASPGSPLGLIGGFSGLFVEFDQLPHLLASLKRRSRGTQGIRLWEEILHGGRAWRTDAGLDWLDDLPPFSSDSEPDLRLSAEGAWRLAERVGFIELGKLKDSGREAAALVDLDIADSRLLFAPMLAKGVRSKLVGQDGVPLLPLLRRAARRLSGTKRPWARQCPGLLPVEVATIAHWACTDVPYTGNLVRDIELNRDLAMHEDGPPDEKDAEYHYERTTESYLERPDLLGRVSVSRGEELASARLLVYCGLFEGVPVYPEYMDKFFLV